MADVRRRSRGQRVHRCFLPWAVADRARCPKFRGITHAVVLTTPISRLRPPRTPRSLACEAPRRDAGHESRAVAECRRREVSVRSHVDAGETLEQRHRTAFGDTSLAVDHQVLL